MIATTSISTPSLRRTRKLKWIPATPDDAIDISTAREGALFHNLSGLPRLQIAIRSTPGDPLARKRAEWFRTVFERAKWAVRGPEDTTAEEAGRGLFLGVGSLPVTPEAAATYLALKAAGFPATPILDHNLSRGTADAGLVLSLIVGSADAGNVG